jgi:hypothetical protein
VVEKYRVLALTKPYPPSLPVGSPVAYNLEDSAACAPTRVFSKSAFLDLMASTVSHQSSVISHQSQWISHWRIACSCPIYIYTIYIHSIYIYMLNRDLTRTVIRTFGTLFSCTWSKHENNFQIPSNSSVPDTKKTYTSASWGKKIDKTGTRLEICPRKSLVRFAQQKFVSAFI